MYNSRGSRRSACAPLLEVADGAHPLRDARCVEVDLTLLANEDIPPADLGLQPLDLLAQPAVGLEKLPAHPGVAYPGRGSQQRLPDEDRPRLLGRHRTVVDTPSRGEREPVE